MPELEEKLDIMFGRIVAMGRDVWVPNSGVLPPEFRDVEEDAYEEEHQGDNANTLHGHEFDNPSRTDLQRSHNTHPVIHKRKRIKRTNSGGRQLFIDHIKELINAARSISSAISTANASQKCVTIMDALEEISHIPEIFDDLEFYDFAIDYIKDRNHRETFMALPTDRKVWWLRRRYHRSFSSLL
ncbi:hypothetical protein M5K25_012072 [Dendrobium thyrsiflorum]|uniref:Uncharacterized protein n=1 Tax=Dendrobium thyrsiflorum TaxID=117978 RepID=A0ABD0V382_DENTH